MSHWIRYWASLLVTPALLLLGGCADDFDPYNEITGSRLLAIAADRPALLPNETAELSALIAGDPDTASYRWSWCPFTAGLDRAYECAVTNAELQAAADQALGAGALEVPAFDLGRASTATLSYSLPPAFFTTLCDLLYRGEVPDFVELPKCDESFEVTVRLEVEIAGESFIGIKWVRLLYEETGAAPNQNPQITGLTAIAPDDPGREIDIGEGGSAELAREVEYTLRVGIPGDAPESYMAVPPEGGPPTALLEDLVVTWFVEAGETDLVRTAFLDGEIDLDRARENLWTTPSVAEHSATETTLYIVIRDDRGGTSWITRELSLEQ